MQLDSPRASDAPADRQERSDSERLLNKLITDPRGQRYKLVKLCGSEVPRDVELYFCFRTFTTVQVRVKARVQVEGLAHEYSLGPGDVDTLRRGGVYELQCQRSAHHLQVKVQPALGLQALAPRPANGKGYAPPELDALLGDTLYALAGLFHVLAALLEDPGRDCVPLAKGPGSTPHVEKLMASSMMVQALLEKCPSLSRQATPPLIRVAEHAQPKSKGELRKALIEVKMLIIHVVQHLRKVEAAFTAKHRSLLHGFLADIQESCCIGGVEAQFIPAEEAARSLHTLVCGSVDSAARADAWKVLQECVSTCRGILPRLRSNGHPGNLRLPSTDFNNEAGGVEFKNDYNRIWQASIEVYLFDMIHSGSYPGGTEGGMRTVQEKWTRPDAPLRLLCPSSALDDAIGSWGAGLEKVLASCAAGGRGRGGESNRHPGEGDAVANTNPRNATGLQNLGENLCAANVLLQVLYSVPLRDAALRAAGPLPGGSGGAQRGEGAAAPPPEEGGEAQQVAMGMCQVFQDMSDPARPSASCREVATVLQGQLGEQQDCDELMHRLSSVLQDAAAAAPGNPCDGLWQAFQKLFVGSTYEVHVRSGAEADASAPPPLFEPIMRTKDDASVIGYPLREDATSKHFLSIPIQRDTETLTQALEEFTGWVATGGSEVAWTKEEFRTLPPFLCFASRQVSALKWEDSINMTRFMVQATPSMLRDHHERSKLWQSRCDLRDAIQHTTLAGQSLSRARLFSEQSFEAEIYKLAETLRQLQTHAADVEQQIAELDDTIGDGFVEPTIAEFFDGVVDEEVVETVIRGLLGADTVKKLADLIFDMDDNGSDMMDQLVQGGAIMQEDAEAVMGKLRIRWKEQRAHTYDVHAVVVYQGAGQFGHYIVFIRQSDGTFLCFDDEQVTEHTGSDAIRAEIVERGSDGFPASVRMVVYVRRGSGEPLDLPCPAGLPCEAAAAKRRKTQ